MSERRKSEQRLSSISSRNHLLINNNQDGQDLAWILSKKIKSEHEALLIKKSFLKLPFFEEMLKYFGEELMGRLFVKTKVESFKEGEYLLKEGSCSNEMFIILQGNVIIKQENEQFAQNSDLNPYQEEMNTQIEKFMNRQDLYRKFIRNRKQLLEENYEKIVKKRQELIEENEKKIKEKQEWEQQKIQWGLVVKHQNRRKFSVYSKRDNNQMDLSNPLLFQKYKFDGISPHHRQGLTMQNSLIIALSKINYNNHKQKYFQLNFLIEIYFIYQQSNYNDDEVQDDLLKVYTENSTKRGRKKKQNGGFKDYASQQVRASASGGGLTSKANQNLNSMNESNPQEKVIKVIEQGDYFGQNSLQEDKIQLYSALAANQVITATISKVLFEEVLFSFFEKNLQKEISFLKDIPLFSSLKQYELDYIHMQMSSKVLEKNAYVYKKGDISSNIYIILDGEVEITYVEDENEDKHHIQSDILLNSAQQQKKEYPVNQSKSQILMQTRLGKCAVFGESELLKKTERRSEVKILSQKAHLYSLPKEYVNILLDKPEFKEELEFLRQQKSQYRKKRIDQLKNIEKEGEIRKNQIRYQLKKLKQIGNAEDPIQSQRKLLQTNSNMLPVISNNISSREINKSQEREHRYNTIALDDDVFEKGLIDQSQSDLKLNQNNVKAAINKYNSIDFNDNRLYDFCQPKYGSVNNVQIHPSKLLPKIQITFEQISNYIDKKSYSYRGNYSQSKEKQQNPVDINSLKRNRNSNNSFQISNIASSKSIDKDNLSMMKYNRSYSLNKDSSQKLHQQQQIHELMKSIPMNNSIKKTNQSVDYGYDMPFENAYIKKQLSTLQPNQINSPPIEEQKYSKQLQIYPSVNHSQTKRKSSIDKINSPILCFKQQISMEGLKHLKSTDITYEDQHEHIPVNCHIPISSSPPPQKKDNFDQDDDDLSLQGDAYTYLKQVKKIPDHYNSLPMSPPKIDPLRPKDKQIFLRKPMLLKQKKKEVLQIQSSNKEPQFFERSIQYQNSVMNMLNYERQRALKQINIENSQQQNSNKKQNVNQ